MTKQIVKIYYIYETGNRGCLEYAQLSDYMIESERYGGFLSEESAIEAIKAGSEREKFYSSPEFVIVPSYKFYGY